MPPLNLLHIIPSVAPVRGGPSQAILQMVQALRSQHINAEIVTTNDSGDTLLDVPLNQWVDYPVGRSPDDIWGTVPVQFFPRYSPNIQAVREYAFSSTLTRWLWENMHRYDLVHVHAIFSYASTAAMAIARLQRVPYIVRPLGQLCHWSLQQGYRKKQTYLSLIERKNLQGSQGIHFTSMQEQQEAMLLNLPIPDRLPFVVPHGLVLPSAIENAGDRLRKHYDLPENQPILLFLSRLHAKKGLDRLITALGQVQLPFTFVIAGSGTPEYTAEIDKLIHQSGLQHCTHRVGFVDGEVKQLLLQGADLFVLPSHSENFGIAVLEAMAAGLPVLVTAGVALASLVQAHQLGWVSEQNPEAIAIHLSEFLRNPGVGKDMGDRARQIVQQQFTWERIAQQLNQRYLQTIRKAVTSK